MPAEAVEDLVVIGGVDAVRRRIAELRALGVERVVVSLVAGDWFRQTELLADAAVIAGFGR